MRKVSVDLRLTVVGSWKLDIGPQFTVHMQRGENPTLSVTLPDLGGAHDLGGHPLRRAC